MGSPIAPEACTSGRPTASQVETLTASLQAALEQLVVDYPEGTPPGPVGRWLTELFNDWPEGKRPDSPADRSSLGVETS